jgi:hypothetical protein
VISEAGCTHRKVFSTLFTAQVRDISIFCFFESMGVS